MFTYIHLKNFKIFEEVKIDLQAKKDTSKRLSVFYGANGGGKTTITQAFYILRRTMETLELKGILRDLIDEKLLPPEDTLFKPEAMLSFFKSRLENDGIENIISEYKRKNSTGNMSLEYGFVISGYPGVYYLEMDNSGIVKERLEYRLNKRRVCFVELEEDKQYINEKIFESKEFYELMQKQISMYWGKHTFLSVLQYQMTDKSDTYINSNLAPALMDLMLAFQNISYRIRRVKADSSRNIDDYLLNLEVGEIDAADEKKLDKIEGLLNEFLCALFSDIQKVYYEKKINNKSISYELNIVKKIGTYEYNIDIMHESDGLREVLEILPFLMLAVSGNCVIIDEYGTGMHDLLCSSLLEIIAEQISGQLIITTHNTSIMERTKIVPESMYFIGNDQEEKRVVKCITEIEERLHPKHNYRTRYYTNPIYQSVLPNVSNEVDVTRLAELYK